VAGDWDGNGTVTAGFVRDLSFHLRRVPSAVSFAG
jgi:hypothetical protein